MNVKPESKAGLKIDPDQGLDLSASSGSIKPGSLAAAAATSSSVPAAANSTMETLIRHQREQLLARASLSSDPAANLDPNSAAAAFAIAAVAAAAAQQQQQTNPLQQAGAANLPSQSSTLYPTSQNNLLYFPAKPKMPELEISQAKKRQRTSSPEPQRSPQKDIVSAGKRGREMAGNIFFFKIEK